MGSPALKVAAILALALWASVPSARADPEVDFANAQRAAARGNYNVAISFFNKVLAVHPDSAAALNGRGVVHARMERPRPAIKDFTAALDLTPDFFDALYNRGLAHASLGERSRAVIDFSRAIELRPGDPHPHLNRAWLYMRRGALGRAAVDLWTGFRLSLGRSDRSGE